MGKVMYVSMQVQLAGLHASVQEFVCGCGCGHACGHESTGVRQLIGPSVVARQCGWIDQMWHVMMRGQTK